MGYDVAIIGAGPAGCTAALTLARAGRSVIVLEKRNFPRPKVCGGCLSGWAVRQLRELVGDRRLLPGTPGSQISFSIGGQHFRCQSGGLTRIVMRSELDDCLANLALDAGAEIRFGQQAGIARNGLKFAVTAGGEAIEAETILLASGLSNLAPKAGFKVRPFGSPMIGRQWLAPAKDVGVAPGAVEMHWLRGGYIGVAAPGGADCIVALAMKSACLAGNDPLSVLKRLNPGAGIWDRIPITKESQVRGTAGFPFVPDRLALANVLLIGDAAGYSEPFSGTGIGMAIHSGISIARAIITGGQASVVYSRAMRLHRRAMWRTRVISAALNSGLTQGLVRRWVPPIDNWVSNCVQRVHVGSAI